MSTTQDWLARWDGALMDNYGTPPVVLARGSGATVWDVDGREYLDLLGGIAVNLLGHAHPAVVEAVCRQVATLGHTSVEGAARAYVPYVVVLLAGLLLVAFVPWITLVVPRLMNL